MSGKISAMYRKSEQGGTTLLRIGNIHVEQGYYCLEGIYHDPRFEENYSNYTRATNWIPRINPVVMKTGYIGDPPRRTYFSWFNYPCKSNTDNSSSRTFYGRKVLKLCAYKREYFTGYEQVLGLNSIFIDSSIEHISPKNILTSSGLNFVPHSSNDLDALVDPRFNDGYDRATQSDFGTFSPYVELNYSVDENYIREYGVISATCKITISDLDRGGKTEFYYLISGNKDGSDEPADINTLKFSDSKVKFDSVGGTKQVSFSPASFGSMMSLSLVDLVGWASCTIPSGSNYIEFSALRNESIYNEDPNDDVPASYRTTQAEVIVKDPRDNHIMGTFYVDMEQEPDTYFYRGKDDLEPTPTTGYNINLTFINNRSSSISFTGKVQLSVRLGTFHTTVMASVPGSNLSSNVIVIPANSTSSVYTASCESILEDMSKLENGDIDDYDVLWYDSSTGHTSSEYLAPYSFTGENTDFKKNGNYTITFNS